MTGPAGGVSRPTRSPAPPAEGAPVPALAPCCWMPTVGRAELTGQTGAHLLPEPRKWPWSALRPSVLAGAYSWASASPFPGGRPSPAHPRGPGPPALGARAAYPETAPPTPAVAARRGALAAAPVVLHSSAPKPRRFAQEAGLGWGLREHPGAPPGKGPGVGLRVPVGCGGRGWLQVLAAGPGGSDGRVASPVASPVTGLLRGAPPAGPRHGSALLPLTLHWWEGHATDPPRQRGCNGHRPAAPGEQAALWGPRAFLGTPPSAKAPPVSMLAVRAW